MLMYLTQTRTLYRWIFIAFLAFLGLNSGCITASAILAGKLIGDAIRDSDVKERYKELEGRRPIAADQMFGRRLETLVDTKNGSRQLLVYPVENQADQRYVVEVHSDRIVVLSKKERNKSGRVTKAVEELRQIFIGKNVADCEREGKLSLPALVLRSVEKGQLVRVYDVKGHAQSGGAHYCVLRFDQKDLCEEINLVGVLSTTKKKGLSET